MTEKPLSFKNLSDAIEFAKNNGGAPDHGWVFTPPGMTLVDNKELHQLKECHAMLDALYEAGVAKWDGYDVALEILEGTEED